MLNARGFISRAAEMPLAGICGGRRMIKPFAFTSISGFFGA
jgi:hypothetical protein